MALEIRDINCHYIHIFITIFFINICLTDIGISNVIPSENPCLGQNGTFTSNPKGCEFFFLCNDGNPIEAYCPSDMWFNPNSGICDLPGNVDCHLNDPVLPNPDDEIIICPSTDLSHIQFIPSKFDCARYYICYHGKPMLQECVREMHWNAKENRCDYPENANCQIRPTLPSCPTVGQLFYPHPYECDYFIFCIHGFSTVQQCPFYHHWDAITETCKWRDVARCATIQNRILS